MRAERLAWAETPAAKVDVERRKPAAAAGLVRRRFLHRSGVRVLARTIDAAAVSLVTIGLCFAAGYDVWNVPLAAAMPFILLPVAALAGVWLAGGYRFHYAGSIPEHMTRVALGAATSMSVVFLVALVFAPAQVELFARLCIANGLAVVALHGNYLGVVRAAMRQGYLSDNVVIVGATQAAARIVSRNVRERELNILGYFDDRAHRATATMMGDAPFLGAVDDLLAWKRLPEADCIIVTVTSTARERVRELIDRMRNLPQEIILVLDLEGFAPETTSLARVVDAPAAYISGAPRDMRRAMVKRVFDVVVAVASGLLLLPVMAGIALLIRLDSKGPALFRQKRHGFNNEIIRVWKFRTMQHDPLAETGMIVQAMPDDPRITRVGRFLRLSSLDELPQLINVLTGEMSIVGPRPHAVGMTAGSMEVMQTVADYAHRHRMKPGMTGWAQINGSRGPCHSQDDVRRRVALDMDYVKRASIWVDAWIVLLTVPRLLRSRPLPR